LAGSLSHPGVRFAEATRGGASARPALGGFRRGAHAPPCPLPFRGDDAAPENAGCDVLSGGDRRGCARREATQKILVSVAELGAVSESIKRRHYSEDAAAEAQRNKEAAFGPRLLRQRETESARRISGLSWSCSPTKPASYARRSRAGPAYGPSSRRSAFPEPMHEARRLPTIRRVGDLPRSGLGNEGTCYKLA